MSEPGHTGDRIPDPPLRALQAVIFGNPGGFALALPRVCVLACTHPSSSGTAPAKPSKKSVPEQVRQESCPAAPPTLSQFSSFALCFSHGWPFV